jgi:hypothetical protein
VTSNPYLTPSRENCYIPTLHIGDNPQVPGVSHLLREGASRIEVPRASRAYHAGHSWQYGEVIWIALLEAMSQAVMRVVAPGEDVALREHPTVHLLPANAIVLHDGLVGDTEGDASLVAPVSGIESYRGLVEGFTCAAEGEEALRV